MFFPKTVRLWIIKLSVKALSVPKPGVLTNAISRGYNKLWLPGRKI